MNAPSAPKEITVHFAQLKKEAAIEPDPVHTGEIKKRRKLSRFTVRAVLVKALR